MANVIVETLQSVVLWGYWSLFVYVIGIYALTVYVYNNFKSPVAIIKSILEPYFQPYQQKSIIERYGKWAVVTGATDGIGKEYSKQLAKQGVNIVLISRTENKLIDVANEIEAEFKIKTKWIVADFAKGRSIYQHIKEELADIPIGILVNNVGKMYDYPDELINVPEDVLWDIININVAGCTLMCRMLAGQMKKNRKGAIVNISSGSEQASLPLMNVYGASKKYIRNFTIALKEELAEYGVTVQLVTPLFVVTKMNQYSHRLMKPGILIPDVKSFAEFALFTLGKTDETTGHWSHGLQYALLNLTPEGVRVKIGHMITKSLRMDYLSSNNAKAQG